MDKVLDLVVDPSHFDHALRAVASRAGLLGCSTAELVLAISKAWHDLGTDLDNQQLEAAIIGIHHDFHQPFPPELLTTDSRTVPRNATGGAAVESATIAGLGKQRRSNWVTGPQIVDIYRAASAMIQLYGVSFNARLIVRHAMHGDDSESRARRYAELLLSGLKKAVTGRKTSIISILHRLCWVGVDDKGFRTTILFHLPPDDEKHVRRWLARRMARADERLLELDVRHPAARREKTARHWKLVRQAWAGADPAIRVGDTSLLDLLQVPKADRSPFGPICGRRFSLSASLGPAALPLRGESVLSALDDRAWTHLFTGWEWWEHDDRLLFEASCHQRKQEIEALFKCEPGSPSLLRRQAELDRFHGTLAVDAYDRPRRWAGWWVEKLTVPSG